MCTAHWQIVEIMEDSVRINDFNNDLGEDNNEIEFDELYPIRLDRDILKRTEFQLMPGREAFVDDIYTIHLEDGKRVELTNLFTHFRLNLIKSPVIGRSINVYSLHQLQNEYFDLTQKALVVDLAVTKGVLSVS